MKSLIVFLSLAFSSMAFAKSDAASCPDIFEHKDNIKIQQIFSGGSKSCFFTVSLMDVKEHYYRDFLFSDDGELMVFNVFDLMDENESQSTGAREFFFFPRAQERATFAWNDSTRKLEVTHVNGKKFYFDYDSADLTTVEQGEVTVNPNVKPQNRGGVEFVKYNGLVLDANFKVGSAPAAVGSLTATFKDKNNNSCSMKNRDLFNINASQDTIFKYDDKGLAAFLKKKCPNLATF